MLGVRVRDQSEQPGNARAGAAQIRRDAVDVSGAPHERIREYGYVYYREHGHRRRRQPWIGGEHHENREPRLQNAADERRRLDGGQVVLPRLAGRAARPHGRQTESDAGLALGMNYHSQAVLDERQHQKEFGQPEEPDLALGGSFTVRRRRSEQ